MITVGKHYADNYNCAHFVSDWYKEKLNVDIPKEGQFELAFVRWLRNNFEQIDRPEENCLVRMKQYNLSHIGVYADNGVYHNYKPSSCHGAVIHVPLGVIKRTYKKVTYWKWSQ